jgi:two-component system cell cycle response regulator
MRRRRDRRSCYPDAVIAGDEDRGGGQFTIAWVGPVELAGAVAAVGQAICAFDEQGWADAAVALIDTSTTGGVDPALELRGAIARSLDVGIVVRCERAEVAELCERLTGADDIALADEPPELVWFRLAAAGQRNRPSRDGLTGLDNMRVFLTALGQASATEEAPASLIVLDLDHFKALNDLLGHPAGDRALREVARRLHRLAPAGTLARVGGEEFALLFSAPPAPARDLGSALIEAIRARPIEGRTLTASAGIASTDGRLAGDELYRHASEALYAAKARGRDRVIHWDDMRREALAQNLDPALAGFENRTRVMAERVAEAIAVHGRRLVSELRVEAEQDGVTGLYTRRYLDRRIPAELEAARAAATPLTLALIDLDSFGRINKDHGWPSGDRVLAETAARVRSAVRADDWVARYGGDEICVIMRGVGRGQAHPILERIRLAVAGAPIAATSGEPLDLTVSIGAAEAGPTDDVPALLERASTQLNQAKRAGRNRVCF